MATEIFSLTNPVFRVYMCHAVVLILKTCLMSALTGFTRMKNKAFANEEDVSFGKAKKVTSHPHVERVRRAHLNDIENIFPFIFLGALYVATGPSAFLATAHFRVFTLARIAHSVVYLLEIPQPSRAMSFMIGMAVNMSMIVQILWQVASF